MVRATLRSRPFDAKARAEHAAKGYSAKAALHTVGSAAASEMPIAELGVAAVRAEATADAHAPQDNRQERLVFWAALLAPLLLVAVCYLPTALRGDFVFDDTHAILNNADVRPLAPLWPLFFHDFWGMAYTDEFSTKSFRPLTVLSFRLNVALGELEAWHFKAVNVALHAAVVAALYFTFASLTLMPLLSSVACCLFASHPASVEAVTSIVGRAELLSLLLALASLQAYRVAERPAACVLLATIAHLSKETGLLVLPLCVLHDVLLGQGSRRWRSWLLLTTISVVLPALRWWALAGDLKPPYSLVDNPIGFIEDRTLRWLAMMRVHWEYARLLFFPSRLSCDYGAGSLEPCTELSSRCALEPLMLYLMVLLLTLCLALGWRSHLLRLSFFGMLWSAIALLPSSHLVLEIGTLVAERLLYMSIAGFSLCTVTLLQYVLRRSWLVALLLAPVIGAFSWRTAARNHDWLDSEPLFRSAVETFPTNARMNNNVGLCILKRLRGDGYEEAIPFIDAAITTFPYFALAYHNRGLASLLAGKPIESLPYFQTSLRIDDSIPLFWDNYGIALSSIGGYDRESAECFENSQKLKQDEVLRPGYWEGRKARSEKLAREEAAAKSGNFASPQASFRSDP